ncbi:hypothetical protein PRZ48_014683 [Zasmidium cellare]|uniref:Uncharacterized protein n=1 Tax=Zasmidium cellare TaxID=395010 RepID=A0ABR0DYY5_ZASCE|nr:hypothetical protein PRZ48_014683 [Zasmidium cellare]
MISSISRVAIKSSNRVTPSIHRKLASSKSTASSEQPSKDDKSLEDNGKQAQASGPSTKTVAQRDAEMMRKMAGLSGEGGEAGVEYEDGKAVAMKRSVKNNMFRLI